MRYPPALVIAIAIAAGSFATGAGAQSIDGLKAGAYDAERAAEEAAAAAEEARRQAAEAAERLKAAEAAAERARAEAAARAAAVEQAEATAPRATAEEAVLEEARAEAERADRRAEEALAAVRALEQRFAYDRSGVYLGGGVFWAPEAFNLISGVDVDIGDSRGLSGWLGYRFSPHFGTEIRVDRLDDFELTGTFEGQDFLIEIDGWLATASAKIYLMTGRIQPYFDFGVGAFIAQIDSDGFSEEDTNAAFRGSVGLDVYLSPSVAVNLNAGFASPTGDLDVVKFGQLGGGLTFRF